MYALFLLCCVKYRRSLAMRILSVRLSVKRLNCDKTEESAVQFFILYERSYSLVFWEEEWLVGMIPSMWNFGSTDPHWNKIANFEAIFSCNISALTPSKKVQSTLIGSPPCAFQWAQDDHRTLPLSPAKGCSKLQNYRFPSKIALRLKKVGYKVSLCETVSDKVERHLLA